MLTLLTTLAAVAASSGEPAQSGALVPSVMPPGNYAVVGLSLEATAAPGDDGLDKVTPTLRFTPRDGGSAVVRELGPIWVRAAAGDAWWRPTARVAKGPDAPGDYDVTLIVARQGEVLAEVPVGATQVIGPWRYTAGVAALLLAIGGALGAAVYRRGRVRAALVGGALLVAGVFWSWLLGGQALFLLLAPVLAVLRRGAPTRARFLSRAALAVLIYQELYWGALVNGAFWTAPVIGVSAICGVAWGLARIVRSERWRAGVAVALATAGSWLYVATNIYKAFFLDIPAIAVAGDAGQVGRLLDSIVLVTRVSHVLAVALPLVILGVACVPAAWARSAPTPRSTSVDAPQSDPY